MISFRSFTPLEKTGGLVVPSKFRIVDLEKVEGADETIQEIMRRFTTSFAVAYATVGESRPHWHNFTCEWYIVLKGSGDVRMDDTVFRVAPGDVVCIPPHSIHCAKKRGKKPLELLVMSAPAWNERDHHIVEEGAP